VKVIISHDVDSITKWEHSYLFLLKHIVRSIIEFFHGSISYSELVFRGREFFNNKTNYLDLLMEFDRRHSIPSVFFFGVSNGRNLDYSLDLSIKNIKKVINKGFHVGVHGIEYDDFEIMQGEFAQFREISSTLDFGIRIHYLKNNDNTIKYIESIGYKYDSTLRSDKNPYKKGSLYEFPLHIMDGDAMYSNGKRWQNVNTQDAINSTINRINYLEKKGVEYLTILFHDRYFCNGYISWKSWYIEVVRYLEQKNCKFISYDEAIVELEGSSE